ncbi:hypothetical protein HC928_02010 [bacterium]|nr:hypothetical protein [bacterium]
MIACMRVVSPPTSFFAPWRTGVSPTLNTVPSRLYKPTGAVSDRYEYEAFGTVLRQTGSTANPYRFTGERFSIALGLYSLRARWYDGGTGRFLTRDDAGYLPYRFPEPG